MINCENACCEEEEISPTQSADIGLDLNEEQRVICCPGNTSFLDFSQRNLKEFPTYLYEKCLCVKVRYNARLYGRNSYYRLCRFKLRTNSCSLQHLYLEGNSLQELSDCFFPSLPSLLWLDVRNNLLRNLPKSVANHSNLEVLLLQGNQIQALPLELGTLQDKG